MYCPECGNDAGDAKFCPECGADLGGVKEALRGKTTGQQGRKTGPERPPKGDPAPVSAPPARGLSPAIIWAGFGAIAVIVIVVVVMATGGFGGDKTSGGSTSSAGPVQAVQADTSGDYRTLVTRANELYDKGDGEFKNQNFEQGSVTFQAAAKVYAAALAKQAGGPVAQAKKVVAQSATFQPAWFNLGNFYAHKARITEQGGSKAKAADIYDLARAVYTRAVALDPKSETGK